MRTAQTMLVLVEEGEKPAEACISQQSKTKAADTGQGAAAKIVCNQVNPLRPAIVGAIVAQRHREGTLPAHDTGRLYNVSLS